MHRMLKEVYLSYIWRILWRQAAFPKLYPARLRDVLDVSSALLLSVLTGRCIRLIPAVLSVTPVVLSAVRRLPYGFSTRVVSYHRHVSRHSV